MANIERVYTIPLGCIFSMPHVRRSKYAIREIKAFGKRHMKSNDVRIGTSLNEFISSQACMSPPRSVKVTAIKDEDGVVRLNLFGSRPDDAKLGAKGKAAAPAKAAEKKEEPKAEAPVSKKVLSDAEQKAAKEAVKAEMKK
ncbi:Ribosomal protein L31e [Candidatus Burarchaeum australiense]|nr:Ribosomal protein L31e [Candidatus Burarchaeum australiense]